LNLSVRAFSDTVRTTLPGAPSGSSASISRVTLTRAPICPVPLQVRLARVGLPRRQQPGHHLLHLGADLARRLAGGAVTRIQVLRQHPVAEGRVVPGQVGAVAPRRRRLRLVADPAQRGRQAVDSWGERSTSTPGWVMAALWSSPRTTPA